MKKKKQIFMLLLALLVGLPLSAQSKQEKKEQKKRGCQEAHCLRELQDRCQDRHADARTLHSLDVSLLIGNQK